MPTVAVRWKSTSTGSLFNENQATIQIRHAYAEVYNDNFRLLAGQTSDLISPLVTHTVNYSVGWAGGNIGFRRMQVRYERYLNFTDTFQITPAVALCQNVINEGVTGGIDPVPDELAGHLERYRLHARAAGSGRQAGSNLVCPGTSENRV